MESKNILIIGGNGFIGKNLHKFLQGKHNLTVIDKSKFQSNHFPGDTMCVQGNVAEKKAFEKLKDHYDVIYHFGSISSIRQYEHNLLNGAVDTLSSFINVMEFAKENGTERVIYPSSGTVYGNSEFLEGRQIEPVNIYGVMKYSSELIANLYSKHFKVCGLRIFMGYGNGEEQKGDIASPVFLFLDKMMRGESPVIWGDGNQSRDLVHIDDIVEIAAKAMLLKEQRVSFDVGTGNNTRFIDLIRMINKIGNIEIEPKFVPKPQNYIQSTTADRKVTVKMLGREPITPTVGIKKFYDYLKANFSVYR